MTKRGAAEDLAKLATKGEEIYPLQKQTVMKVAAALKAASVRAAEAPLWGAEASPRPSDGPGRLTRNACGRN